MAANSGAEYTVLAPPTELRKDVGEDTWLFTGWNTKQDGSGTEYKPGEEIIVTEDITLYAQWYQQTKHTVVMNTSLDGVATDIAQIAGYDRTFYARREGGDGTYIPLTRKDTGVYSTKVAKNDTYVICAQTADGEYEPVHDHKVVIYNRNGTLTDCSYYSVTYNTDNGTWAEDGTPANQIHHHGEAVTAYDKEKTPTREGHRFLGWKDRNGNLYAPGQRITDSISGTLNLTAQWEETITVMMNVVIDHEGTSGGADNDSTKREESFTLLRKENGVELPIEERHLTGGTYNSTNNETT